MPWRSFPSTGYGVFHAIKVAAEHAGIDLKKARVAIDGFGNVGSFLAKYLSDYGTKIVAASDSRGCIYNPDGLEYEKLKEVKKETRTVINYTPGQILKNEELFEFPVDILVPASIPDVINEKTLTEFRRKSSLKPLISQPSLKSKENFMKGES